MLATKVISRLHQRGITLRVVNGGLKVRGAEKLSDREKAALKAHRNAILRALTASPTVPIGTAKQAATTGATAVTRPSSQAAINREAMPQVVAAVDAIRAAFGPIQVIFASEGGKELGREPPPGVKPVITSADAPKRTARREGWL